MYSLKRRPQSPVESALPKRTLLLPAVNSPARSRLSGSGVKGTSFILPSPTAHREQARSVTPLLHRTKQATILQVLKDQHCRLEAALSDRARKVVLARQLRRRYHTRFNRTDIELYSEYELTAMAKRKWAVRVAKRCAKRMKRWLQSRLASKIRLAVESTVNAAATRIQRFWRQRRAEQSPKQQKANAAVCIQRHFRGFLARTRYKTLKFYSDLTALHLNARLMRRISNATDPVQSIFRFWVRNYAKMQSPKADVPQQQSTPVPSNAQKMTGKQTNRRESVRANVRRLGADKSGKFLVPTTQSVKDASKRLFDAAKKGLPKKV